MAGKTAMVSIRIVSDANTRGFRKAADAAGKLGRNLAKFTAMSTGVAAAAAGLSGVVGSLGLGIVALGAVAGPALAPLLMGMEGIKSAAGNAAEGFNALKQTATDALADSMAPGFTALNGLMLDLNADFKNLSYAVGQSFSDIATHMASPAIAGGFAALLAASADFVDGTTSGINELITGFAALGPAIAPVANQLGAAFGDMIGSIGRALSTLASSGTMTSLVAGFSSVMIGLGDVVEPLLVLLGEAGAAIGPGLGAALSSLGVAVSGLIGPFATMAGVVGDALATAFAALAPAIGPIGSAFAALVVAVAPLVGPLAQVAAVLGTAFAGALSAVAPLVAEVAQLFAGVLAGALQAVAPVIPVIVAAIAQLAAGLMPLIPPLAEVAAALLPAFGAALQAVAPVLPVLVGAIVSLATAIVPVIPPLAQVAMALLPALASVVVSVAPLVATLAGVIVQLLGAVLPVLPPIAQLAQSLFPALASVIQLAASVISPLISLVGRVAGLFAGALVAGVTAAAGVFSTIAGAISTVVGWVNRLIGAIGSIRWPSPPSWLGSILGSTDMAGVTTGIAPGDTETIAYGRFNAGALLGGLGTAAAISSPAAATVVNINVTGALDPRAVADQIRSVLRADARTRGLAAASARTGGTWQ